MSFSNDVKESLTRLDELDNDERVAEILGLCRTLGALFFSAGKKGLVLSSNKLFILRYFLNLLNPILVNQKNLRIGKNSTLRGRSNYSLELIFNGDDDCLVDWLQLHPLWDEVTVDYYYKKFLYNERLKKSFLKSVFLGCGNITNPQTGYHLELVCKDSNLARLIADILNTFLVSHKVVERKKVKVIYINNFAIIVRFLTLIGAYSTVLELESHHVVKDVRNLVNRRVNCDTANLNKSIDVATKHLGAIKYINAHAGLSSLPDKLNKTAILRLEYPEASLKELADIEGTVSRSTLGRRLNKIVLIAMKMGYQEGKASKN